ncbi:MAG: 1,4-alpha-glucan branching protein GlgB [Bacteroidota bacterium]
MQTDLAYSHQQELTAIVQAKHSAPHQYLGIDQNDDGQWIARFFRPQAKQLKIKGGPYTVDADCIHEDGVFEVQLSDEMIQTSPLICEEKRYDGSTRAFIDAFQFEPQLNEDQLHYWDHGEDRRAWHWMGAHQRKIRSVTGFHFVVWAPHASRVSVVGEWNSWDGRVHPMRVRGKSGLWELFIPEAQSEMLYKYEIQPLNGSDLLLKADPFAFQSELRPGTASRLCGPSKYQWNDEKWLDRRPQRQRQDQPLSIYEVHAGSWQHPDGGVSYEWLQEHLVPYVKQQGYTHVEFLPLAEHPYDPSWGYQITGYFAPTSRFGTPDQLRSLIDAFHNQGIGVIFDWVPGHFTTDDHGLAYFDGEPLFEYADWRLGEHKTWGTQVFDYVRPQVRNFLINNALYWMEEFHVDGLRVDAVASMLYRDYDRADGEWLPNREGSNEHWEAIDFLKECNREIKKAHPDVWLIAEESTAWEGITQSVSEGGLGFDLKWNMGWMNDTLEFMQTPIPDRLSKVGKITFAMVYAYTERFVLPLSHDEVVHMKQSLLHKMPGYPWQQFANLRLLLTWQYFHPGKPLQFMGSEIAQRTEWNHDAQLEWGAMGINPHGGMQQLVQKLNAVYKRYKSAYASDHEPDGFSWLISNPQHFPVLAFRRSSTPHAKPIVAIFNFSDRNIHDMQIGVPNNDAYKVLINTDHIDVGGQHHFQLNRNATYNSWSDPLHGQRHRVSIPVAALSALIITPE